MPFASGMSFGHRPGNRRPPSRDAGMGTKMGDKAGGCRYGSTVQVRRVAPVLGKVVNKIGRAVGDRLGMPEMRYVAYACLNMRSLVTNVASPLRLLRRDLALSIDAEPDQL